MTRSASYFAQSKSSLSRPFVPPKTWFCRHISSVGSGTVPAMRCPRAGSNFCYGGRYNFRMASGRYFLSTVVTERKDNDEGRDVTGPSRRSTKETLQRIMDLSRPEMKLIALSAATLGVTSSTTLLLPYLSGQVIDAALIAANSPNAADFDAIPIAGGLFGLTAIAGGGVYVRSLLLSKAANRIVSRLRRRLFASMISQETAFFDLTRSGDMISRLSADAQLVQAAVTTQAVSALRGVVMSTGSAAMLFQTSMPLAVLSLATLPPVLLAARMFGRSFRDRQTMVQRLHAESTAIAEETVNGIKTVKQFGAEMHEVDRYAAAVIKAHDEAISAGKAQAFFDGAVHVAANGAVLMVLGYGGGMVLAGELTAGDLAGFLMYSLLMAGNISSISSTYAETMKSIAAAGRVFQVVDRIPAIPSNFDTIVFRGDTGDLDQGMGANDKDTTLVQELQCRQLSVEFRDVSFSYPSRDTCVIGPHMALKVKPGEKLSIVGGSGSGKSTLAALLTRLYDVSHGCLLIDGQDVRDLDPWVLRECIGVTAQEPILFATTIEENIRYGRFSASREEIYNAARLANVLDFVSDFPDGLGTSVGPRGTQLSGGQKQRVAIARTILKDPRIVIFDEATSALDSESEFAVKKALDTAMEGRTVIQIAHRLSTIQQSDRIAVLKHGVIKEIGSYSDLIEREDGHFRELMKRQLVD